MTEIAISDVNADPLNGPEETPMTDSEKLDYLFAQAKQVEALVAQAGPLIAQAGPMLDSLAPLLGQASSPMGRIFGSIIR